MANEVEKFIRTLSNIERRVSNVERNNQSQRFTSIDATNIQFRDENGNVTGSFGRQPDGSTAFVPVPAEPRTLAVPTAPLLDQGVGNVVVTYSGLLESGELPLDFSCFEVHLGDNADFEVSESTMVTVLRESVSSSVVAGPLISGTHFFRLRLRALNGEVSEASQAAEITVSLDLPDLEGSLANASGGSNYYSPDKPVGGNYTGNDLWFDSGTDPETGLVSWLPHRWDETLGDWVSIEDERIAALEAAQNDMSATIDELINTPSGLKIHNSLTDPVSSPDDKTGDIWQKWDTLADGGELLAAWRFDGVWISQSMAASYLPKVNIGSGTFGDLSGGRLELNSVRSNRLLIGDTRNWIPNGNLSNGNADNWPEPPSGTGPVYSDTDKPDGLKASASYHTGYTTDFSDFGAWSVDGAETVVFEVWVKADKPDSRIYIEIRDQDGAHAGTASYSDGKEGWIGDTSTYPYPIGNTIVPTEWTKLRSELKVANTTTELSIGSVYFNHGNGSERDATVSLAGMKLAPMVGSTLIEDGAIQTVHLAAKSINSASGVVGDLDAGNITFGEMSGLRIKAGTIYTAQLDSEAINGMVITGAHIKAGIFETGVAGESRVQISPYLWNDAPIFDGIGDIVSTEAGTGIRVGVDAGTSADMYYVPKGNVGYESFTIRGPNSGPVILMTSDGPDDGSIYMTSKDSYGKSRMSFSGAANGIALTSTRADSPGSYVDSILSIEPDMMKMSMIGENGWMNQLKLYKETGEIQLNTGSNIFLQGRGLNPVVINAVGAQDYWNVPFQKDAVTEGYIGSPYPFSTNSFGILSAPGNRLMLGAYEESVFVESENTYPMIVKYKGGSDNWFSQFAKGNTAYGYIGSPGAVGSNDFSVMCDPGRRQLSLVGTGGSILELRNGAFQHEYTTHRPTGGSANVYMASNGVLAMASSSRRYKTDEQLIEADQYSDKILNVEYKSWIQKRDLELYEEFKTFQEENPGCPAPEHLEEASYEYPRRYVGTIAEDLHDAGLEEFVEYDEFGRPNGVQYDRFGVALIPIIRELRDRISQVEAAKS